MAKKINAVLCICSGAILGPTMWEGTVSLGQGVGIMVLLGLGMAIFELAMGE